jgi:hypothetical protein
MDQLSFIERRMDVVRIAGGAGAPLALGTSIARRAYWAA